MTKTKQKKRPVKRAEKSKEEKKTKKKAKPRNSRLTLRQANMICDVKNDVVDPLQVKYEFHLLQTAQRLHQSKAQIHNQCFFT
jgi:hypothetical protein